MVISVKERHGVRDNKEGLHADWEARKDFPVSAIWAIGVGRGVGVRECRGQSFADRGNSGCRGLHSEMQRLACLEHGKCRARCWERQAEARLWRNLYFISRIGGPYHEGSGEPSEDDVSLGIGTICLCYAILAITIWVHQSSPSLLLPCNCMLCFDFPNSTVLIDLMMGLIKIWSSWGRWGETLNTQAWKTFGGPQRRGGGGGSLRAAQGSDSKSMTSLPAVGFVHMLFDVSFRFGCHYCFCLKCEWSFLCKSSQCNFYTLFTQLSLTVR